MIKPVNRVTRKPNLDPIQPPKKLEIDDFSKVEIKTIENKIINNNFLVEKLEKRVNRFIQNGTTTIEAKSGYGLDTDSELKSLSVIDRVNQKHAIDIIPTFMGAHAIPAEYNNNPNDYINLVCDEMIPEVSKQGIA